MLDILKYCIDNKMNNKNILQIELIIGNIDTSKTDVLQVTFLS